MKTQKERISENLILLGRDGGYLYSFMVASAILCSIIFSIVLSLISNGESSIFSTDGVIILNYLVSPIAMLFAIGFLRYKRKAPLMVLELNKKFNLLPLICAVLIFIGIQFSLGKLNEYFVTALTTIGFEISAPTLPTKSAMNVILTVVIVCVLPAVMEEYAFRGVITNALRSTGNAFAIIASGLLFSLFHMSPSQTIYQFVVGCLYSAIIIYGGNILYAIVMHFLNNLYVVINYYYIGFNPTGIIEYVLIAVGLICLVLGVLILIKKGEKEIELSKEFRKVNRREFLLGASLGLLTSVITWIVTLVV